MSESQVLADSSIGTRGNSAFEAPRIIYNAELGKSREIPSFEQVLREKIKKNPQIPSSQADEKLSQYTELFLQARCDICPLVIDVLGELKRLGIENDMLIPTDLQILSYAVKTDIWGERPKKDYPQTTESHIPDPNNPLNEIIIMGDKVKIDTLNTKLNTTELQSKLQDRKSVV